MLTKMTVNLVPAAAHALAVIGEHSVDSKTDGVNRALQLYAWWLTQETAGNKHYVRTPDGSFYLAETD